MSNSVEIAVWLKRIAREEERVEQGGTVLSGSREERARRLRIAREVLVGHLLADLRGCRV